MDQLSILERDVDEFFTGHVLAEATGKPMKILTVDLLNL